MAGTWKGIDWPCSRDEIWHEREELAKSWKAVAEALGLGEGKKNRARYAYRCYEDLTGISWRESKPTGVRRNGGGGGGGRKSNAEKQAQTIQHRLDWDDDTDQDEIEAALLGTMTVANNGERKWNPVVIHVLRDRYGGEYIEEIPCRYATAFSYGPEGDQPLQVEVAENYSGGLRTLFVSKILKVVR